jgi:hypothetical protein
MPRTGGTRGKLPTCSHSAARRHRAGPTCWPILISVIALALMTAAPSAAYAQCFLGASASVGTINTAFIPSGPAFLSSEPNSGPDQQSGGEWTRAVGGTVTTQAPNPFNGSFTVTPPGGHSFRIPFSELCNSPVKQDFAGFEVGHDIAVLNTNNSDWHFGVLAGYLGVKVSSPPAPVFSLRKTPIAIRRPQDSTLRSPRALFPPIFKPAYIISRASLRDKGLISATIPLRAMWAICVYRKPHPS